MPNGEQEKSKTGSAFLTTYPPSKEGGTGHSTLYFTTSRGESKTISLNPSSTFGQASFHLSNGITGMLPVNAFNNSKGPAWDAKHNGTVPRVVALEGLDTDAMLEDQRVFEGEIKGSRALFCLTSSKLNFFSSIMLGTMSSVNTALRHREKTGFFPDHCPMTDTQLIHDDIDTPEVKSYNCADAVGRTLRAGGFTFPKQTLFQSFRRLVITPDELEAIAIQQGGKVANNSSTLPPALQEAITIGQKAQETSTAAHAAQQEIENLHNLFNKAAGPGGFG